jgi:GT2 family glycosyltransferase
MSNEKSVALDRLFAGRPELASPQPHFEATPNLGTQAGLVSVIVPCCGQLEYTKLCVPRLLRHSRPPFELIFVDVASLDGTPEYLAGVAGAAPVRVEVVLGSAEASFPAAVAEGLSRAQGPFIVWLNNDVLVPALWLEQLVALASSNPVIGMVGPMSNCAPAEQTLAAPYRLRRKPGQQVNGQGHDPLDTEPVDRFAAEHRQQHKGEWTEVARLGGFCMLLKREALAGGRLLDDADEAGIFDATKLSLQVRRAGYRLACCKDLFVHHFGTRVSGS